MVTQKITFVLTQKVTASITSHFCVFCVFQDLGVGTQDLGYPSVARIFKFLGAPENLNFLGVLVFLNFLGAPKNLKYSQKFTPKNIPDS